MADMLIVLYNKLRYSQGPITFCTIRREELQRVREWYSISINLCALVGLYYILVERTGLEPITILLKSTSGYLFAISPEVRVFVPLDVFTSFYVHVTERQNISLQPTSMHYLLLQSCRIATSYFKV